MPEARFVRQEAALRALLRAPAAERAGDGFTFNGRHSLRDMGCAFFLEERTAVFPQARHVYRIPGLPGTLRYEGEDAPGEGAAVGTLYLLSDAPLTREESAQRLAEIAAWLSCGRAPLIWDEEPEAARMAELSGATFTRRGFSNGALRLRFTVQPTAFSPGSIKNPA